LSTKELERSQPVVVCAELCKPDSEGIWVAWKERKK
jgi:hypothetical protein